MTEYVSKTQRLFVGLLQGELLGQCIMKVPQNPPVMRSLLTTEGAASCEMANLSGSERLRTFMSKIPQGVLTGSMRGVLLREQSSFRRLNYMIRLLTLPTES